MKVYDKKRATMWKIRLMVSLFVSSYFAFRLLSFDIFTSLACAVIFFAIMGLIMIISISSLIDDMCTKEVSDMTNEEFEKIKEDDFDRRLEEA